jgi:NurA-like 5'-3' nuclease
MLLVKFDDNWADEMDVSGFKLFDNLDAWNAAIAEFKAEKEIVDGEDNEDNGYFEVCFGTNEYIEYETVEEFLTQFDITEISDAAAAVIETLFPEAKSYGYGHFPL